MKYIIIFIIIITLALSALIGIRGYSYYSPAKERVPYQTIQHNDDTIRIAYIGDSWAYMHESHSCQLSTMIENKVHRPVIVKSHGICGLTSKEIYEAFFEDNSYKKFLTSGFNFCIISAGINDTYKKMSVNYYKKSMDCIIRFFLANHIRPIILEIPDYNIEKAYERQTSLRKILRQLSMFVNNTPLDCKQMFRESLDDLIKERGYEQEVNVIRYKEWNANYDDNLKTLYIRGGMHLNENGYANLDSSIASTVKL